MEFFLMIFLTFIFSFSRADWTMHHPIYRIIGETFYLHYTTEYDVFSCSFYIPNSANGKSSIIVEPGNNGSLRRQLPGKRPAEWTWSSYGMDNKRDCGIQINSAAMNDSGEWKIVIIPNREGDNPLFKYDDTLVYIFAHEAPDRVVLEPDNIPPIAMWPRNDYKPMDKNITCTAYKTRGDVTLIWWIGDNLISSNVSKNIITNNTSDDAKWLYKDVSQVFRYFPVPSHDGKQLKCIANHSEYTKEDLANKTNIAAIDITIRAPPVPHEKDIVFKNYPMGNLSIDIQFHANPPPSSIYWKMHDMKKQLGNKKQTSGRYTTLGLKSTGNGDYTATIRVSNLSKSDGGLQNILLVKNEIGNTSYTFTFDFEKDPVQGLKVGEIAGIVLACLGAACLIFLVVSQLRKRKSKEITPEGAENREEMRETSRT